ncbi:MAG: LETM1-related biofilm-associated protein [Crocinitomicaceae bacterium]
MMNPSSNGWIRKFFSIIKDYQEGLNEYPGTMSAEELIYGYLQPTGIMYGFPTKFIFLEEDFIDKWSGEEKFKVLLLEGLILVDHINEGKFDVSSLETSLENFVKFYEETELEKAKKSWLNFKGLDVYEKLESIIERRVDIKMSFSNKLWTSYLHNSLIFQDLILYHEYKKRSNSFDISEKRRKVMLDMMKLVSVAAHADGEIAEEEEALFQVFMASAKLDSDDRDIAEAFWENNGSLADIEFNYEMTWLLKRYFMEIATLTVWSDKVVTDSEEQFLKELVVRFVVEEEEQDKSFLAIQSFVIENAEHVPFLSGKNETEQLMDGARDKWRKILGRNKEKLGTELKQSKELVALIAKSAKTELTPEEKKKVKAQFKDLGKSIPAFTLFMLPGGSLVMPIVLKLIPDLVPSAFRSNQIDEEESSS